MRKFRKHIRLKGFDYSESLYYFVTICTRQRRKLFVPFIDPKYGHEIPVDVVDAIGGENGVAAPFYGARQKVTEIIVDKLGQIPKYYPVEIDFYAVMSDHLHMVVYIKENRKVSLALVVKAFKSWVTMEVKEAAQSAAATDGVGPSGSIWQPNYYEHIIRSEGNLNRIRNYILQNPYIEYDEINWKMLDPKL